MVDQWYYQNVLYVIVKNQDFWKNKEAKGLWNSLGLKTPLNKIPFFGNILFWMQFYWIDVISIKRMK